ncbi:MAG: hypothetical protein MZV63_38300 [Marinilabiliales bacterium]|nr:hypothetical protein [Marinilabiliales bacterium]
MTHEKEWFQYINQLAKRKNWLINEIKWSGYRGAIFENKPSSLRELIETNLAKGEVDFWETYENLS